MVNRRELILFGLLLGTISLAFGQAKTADVTPNPAPIAVPAAPIAGANPAEEPAAGQQDLYVLFNGEDTLPPQIVMGGWGFMQQDATVKPFEPKRLTAALHSPYYLYISTLGRYEGVRFDFPQPLPAAELLRVKNVFLELYVRAGTTCCHESRFANKSGRAGSGSRGNDGAAWANGAYGGADGLDGTERGGRLNAMDIHSHSDPHTIR